MTKLIIENNSSVSDVDALEFVKEIIAYVGEKHCQTARFKGDDISILVHIERINNFNKFTLVDC